MNIINKKLKTLKLPTCSKWLKEMEMPTPCSKCKEVVELNDLRESSFTKEMLCDDCYSADLKQGFFYREGQKTSAGIEQLVNESEMASKATLRNQYY